MSAERKSTGWAAPKDHYAVPVLFNPYTGEPRDARDVQSDPQGTLIAPPGKVEMLAAPASAAGIDRKKVWHQVCDLLISRGVEVNLSCFLTYEIERMYTTQPATAGAAQADDLTYTVNGVVMTPLEYIDYLHNKLAAQAAIPEIALQAIIDAPIYQVTQSELLRFLRAHGIGDKGDESD